MGTPEEQAKQIVADITVLFDNLRAKCRETEDNTFIQKLKNYDTQIKDGRKNFSIERYEKIICGIQDTPDKNTYHCLSENDEVREWFYRLRLECFSLWQLYRSMIA